MINQNSIDKVRMFNLIKELFEKSVNSLYSNDSTLIDLKMEQASQARIFYYMQRDIENLDEYKILREYDLDCEYNHLGNGKKTTLRKLKGSKPDIVLHKRKRKDNLLVIEIKINKSNENDIIKLEDYTNQKGNYSYLLGVLLILKQQNPTFMYFVNGALIKMENS